MISVGCIETHRRARLQDDRTYAICPSMTRQLRHSVTHATCCKEQSNLYQASYPGMSSRHADPPGLLMAVPCALRGWLKYDQQAWGLQGYA